MRHWRRGANSAAAAAAALLWATQAEAQGSDKNWMNAVIGPTAYASNDLSDRELIKEWEANPEKGFATLGPSNGLLEGRRVNTGQVRGLTILVEFQDVTSTVTKNDVSEMLNAANYTKNGNFCSARDYFLSISSGKLDYTNVVVGPFKLSKTRQFYTTNLLVKEAMDRREAT